MSQLIFAKMLCGLSLSVIITQRRPACHNDEKVNSKRLTNLIVTYKIVNKMNTSQTDITILVYSSVMACACVGSSLTRTRSVSIGSDSNPIHL